MILKDTYIKRKYINKYINHQSPFSLENQYKENNKRN